MLQLARYMMFLHQKTSAKLTGVRMNTILLNELRRPPYCFIKWWLLCISHECSTRKKTGLALNITGAGERRLGASCHGGIPSLRRSFEKTDHPVPSKSE